MDTIKVISDKLGRSAAQKNGWVIDEDFANYTIDYLRGGKVAQKGCGRFTLLDAQARVVKLQSMYSKNYYRFQIRESLTLGSIKSQEK